MSVIVKRLRYRLDHDDDISFDAPPVEFAGPGFEGVLEDGIVTIELLVDRHRVRDARRLVEGYLRAWQFQEAFGGAGSRIAFLFLDAKVEPSDPVSGGDRQPMQVDVVEAIQVLDSVKIDVTKRRYPTPPVAHPLDPDVETMWRRFSSYQEGREPLLGMASFCLTLVERKSGVQRDQRRAAARRFRVDIEVLRKLGDLTANRGEELTARKFPAHGAWSPLTSAERRWVEATVRRLGIQVANVQAGVQVDELTLAGLPPLE